ncbi:MAG: hypothetical protein QGM45_10250, partial [Anaerolineales bacterium]|nr:hypothetical protein [Anaerolineales bacterium]
IEALRELSELLHETDPRQIAVKEKLKQQRRDAYPKVKERGNVLKAERKKAADEKAADVSGKQPPRYP